MPYPSYMDQLGAWSSSPSPLDPGAQYDPTSQPTASIAGSSDPNANMSSQDIMDMIRKKQQDYAGDDLHDPALTDWGIPGARGGNPDPDMATELSQKQAAYTNKPTDGGFGATGVPVTPSQYGTIPPWTGAGSPTADRGISDIIRSSNNAASMPGWNLQGITTPQTSPADAQRMTDEQDRMAGGSATQSMTPTQVPSNQDLVVGGNPGLRRNMTPEQWNALVDAAKAGGSQYNSSTITGSGQATNGQTVSTTPGQRMGLPAAASILAKQKLGDLYAQMNQQADLANQRRMALAAVPGQSAVNLQNARNTGAQAIQGMQNTNEQTLQAQRLSQQQQQWEDQRPLREAQVRQLASQSGMNDAETKAKLAAIDNTDTPQSRTARAAMQYATALDPNDPSKGDIFMQALNSLGGQPGAAGGGTAGIAQAVGQSNDYAADRNTAQYMATDPEYAATVKALKGAKPGLGTALSRLVSQDSGPAAAVSGRNGTAADRFANGNESKWVDAVNATQAHFNTIAARKHLNAKALMDGAMKQVQ